MKQALGQSPQLQPVAGTPYPWLIRLFQAIWRRYHRTFGTWRLIVLFAKIRPAWQRLVVNGPDRGRFYLDLRDPCCLGLLYRGFLEWTEVKLLANLIPPDAVGMDIGANTGYWSRALLSLRPQISVYAFEPSRSTFDLLALNCVDFPSINPVRVALSDETGETQFGGENSSDLRHLGGQGEIVEMSTLDEWNLANHISRVDFLKIDVEGAEAKVLQGAIASLQKFRPIVLFEFIPENAARLGNNQLEKIQAMFAGLNYSIQRVRADGRLTLDLATRPDTTSNFLARPQILEPIDRGLAGPRPNL